MGRAFRPVRRAAAVLTVATAVLGMVGCNSSPELDDLAPRFEQDARALIHYLANTLAKPREDFDIVSDSSEDVACSGEARQRVFEATFVMRDGDPDDNLDDVRRSVWTAFGAYGLEDRDDPDFYTEDGDYYAISQHGAVDDLGTERTFTATNDDETITFEVRAAGHPGSTVVVSGETVCAE